MQAQRSGRFSELDKQLFIHKADPLGLQRGPGQKPIV